MHLFVEVIKNCHPQNFVLSFHGVDKLSVGQEYVYVRESMT